MLTGRLPFRGSASEVMYQHQRMPLPLEQLKAVPQPVVVLLEVLLEKDPARRFQNPAELLKAILEITAAIHARRKITLQSLQKTPSAASRSELASRQQNLDRRKFHWPDCPLLEPIYLVGRRISLSWMMHGQTRM
jgi:serine/threonine protein kinase